MKPNDHETGIDKGGYGDREGFIHEVGQTTTVFDLAWELYREGRLPVWGSVLAESQTRGRGRGGKVWFSPPGHIYAALRLPATAPFDGPSASITLALLISQALEELFQLRVMIKWPNDIILEKKKIGGLLLESRQGAVIAGLGLNLVSPPPSCREEPEVGLGGAKAPQAGALPIIESPAKLWRKLVKKILVCYNLTLVGPDQATSGAGKIMGLATERLLGLGQEVTILAPSTEPPFPDRILAGLLIGLDSSGALLIERDRSRFAVWSGSLFLDI
jgi:BirA family biotin operon repressor/biotin-[acetyl-CoA-carboxylase] ligase